MRVGISLPVAESEDYQPKRYAELRELAQTAEDVALDSIWAPYHLLYQPEPGQTSTRLLGVVGSARRAGRGNRAGRLGHLVACLPFRSPGVTAYMANTLDEIIGGRFVLGVGSGWHEPEFSAFGFECERRVSFYEESLAVIVPLLRGEAVDWRPTSGSTTRSAPSVATSWRPFTLACPLAMRS